MAKKMFTLLPEGSSTPVYNILDSGAEQYGHSTYTINTATFSPTADENAGRTGLMDKADGITVTLPTATGSGNIYKFFVKTTLTSAGKIQVGSASETISGVLIVATDSAGQVFPTLAATDTITMNGTTTGGVEGSYVEITDIDTNKFLVVGHLLSTGVEATPYSASVS